MRTFELDVLSITDIVASSSRRSVYAEARPYSLTQELSGVFARSTPSFAGKDAYITEVVQGSIRAPGEGVCDESKAAMYGCRVNVFADEELRGWSRGRQAASELLVALQINVLTDEDVSPMAERVRRAFEVGNITRSFDEEGLCALGCTATVSTVLENRLKPLVEAVPVDESGGDTTAVIISVSCVVGGLALAAIMYGLWKFRRAARERMIHQNYRLKELSLAAENGTQACKLPSHS